MKELEELEVEVDIEEATRLETEFKAELDRANHHRTKAFEILGDATAHIEKLKALWTSGEYKGSRPKY